MKSLKASISLVALCLALPAAPKADDFAESLSHAYQNHVFGVRHPIHAGIQEFDDAGHPVNTGSPPAWEIYGGVFIDKLQIQKDRLQIEGYRVLLTGGMEKGKPANYRLGKAYFEIHLDQPITSMDEAQTVLGRIFYLDGNDIQHRKPEVRRAGIGADIENAYELSNKTPGFILPKPQYTPTPLFSESARREGIQGTELLSVVVDKTGAVVAIRIEQGLGYGLDESALDTVKTWRFTPGTRNGEPVSVHFPISVSFNLYYGQPPRR
jgi:TonB family protein